jgi:phosphatidate phosphatase APP1
MTNWKGVAAQLLRNVDERLDGWKLGLKLRHGWLDPLMIQPYRGHGTGTTFYLKGRVLEHTGVTHSSSTDSLWENVLNMYRRFGSDELPHARVQARVGDQTWDAVTDEEGYFTLELALREPVDARRVWHTVQLDLLEPKLEDNEPVHAVGHVLVPPPDAQFGIISDIDDTVVRTSATDVLQMARIVLLTNAHTRVPFEGVAEFYRALRYGTLGTEHNPLFYVSSSPWNLYDLLVDFLNVHGIPVGPLFLRDFGLNADMAGSGGHHTHKLAQIHGLLAAYPQLSWVLMGDSGQEDPEIYREVVREFPGRVKAVYIRDVVAGERHQEAEQIAGEVCAAGVPMLLVPDTYAAAKHAAAVGLIDAAALPKIQAKKEQDERAPDLLSAVTDGK